MRALVNRQKQHNYERFWSHCWAPSLTSNLQYSSNSSLFHSMTIPSSLWPFNIHTFTLMFIPTSYSEVLGYIHIQLCDHTLKCLGFNINKLKANVIKLVIHKKHVITIQYIFYIFLLSQSILFQNITAGTTKWLVAINHSVKLQYSRVSHNIRNYGVAQVLGRPGWNNVFPPKRKTVAFRPP